MSRMRFGQSAADADTLTRARPLATSTESVSCHTEENLGVVKVECMVILRTQSPDDASTQLQAAELDGLTVAV